MRDWGDSAIFIHSRIRVCGVLHAVHINFCFTFLWCGFFLVTMLLLLLISVVVLFLFHFYLCFLPLSLLNLQVFNFRTWWKHFLFSFSTLFASSSLSLLSLQVFKLRTWWEHFCMGTLPVLSLLYGRVATGHFLHLLSFVIPDQYLPGETPEDRQ